MKMTRIKAVVLSFSLLRQKCCVDKKSGSRTSSEQGRKVSAKRSLHVDTESARGCPHSGCEAKAVLNTSSSRA